MVRKKPTPPRKPGPSRRARRKSDGNASADLMQAVRICAHHLLGDGPWEHEVPRALERLGRAAAVSRVCVFENGREGDDSQRTTQFFEWTPPGVAPPG